jgi:hypothetical protein
MDRIIFGTTEDMGAFGTIVFFRLGNKECYIKLKEELSSKSRTMLEGFFKELNNGIKDEIIHFQKHKYVVFDPQWREGFYPPERLQREDFIQGVMSDLHDLVRDNVVESKIEGKDKYVTLSGEKVTPYGIEYSIDLEILKPSQNK